MNLVACKGIKVVVTMENTTKGREGISVDNVKASIGCPFEVSIVIILA